MFIYWGSVDNIYIYIYVMDARLLSTFVLIRLHSRVSVPVWVYLLVKVGTDL